MEVEVLSDTKGFRVKLSDGGDTRFIGEPCRRRKVAVNRFKEVCRKVGWYEGVGSNKAGL